MTTVTAMRRRSDQGGGPSVLEVLTPLQAADLLHLSVNQVYRLLNAGELPGKRVRGNWRLSHRQVIDWLEGRS